MADAWEMPKKRGVDVDRAGSTFRRGYFARRASTEADARDKILAIAPTDIEGVTLTKLAISEVGRGHWLGNAIWGPAPEDEDDQREFECDITTETQRITQSLATTKYPNVAATPDHQGAIGVAEDGRAEGVDWYFPDMPFSCVRTLPDASVTGTYINTLWGLVTKTNSQQYSLTIKGLTLVFQVEELLFLGCKLRRNFADDFWNAAYRFHARKSQTNLTIGTITGINKPGWRHLDVSYRRKFDAANSKSNITVPAYVYIHQVAETGNFQGLGL